MRYRKLDANGDMQFGHGSGDFWFNQPEAVGQSVKTRLLLFSGEWYLDTVAGTPWGGFPLNDLVVEQGQILGVHTQLSRDAAIRERILTTEGVTSLVSYYSYFNPDTRAYAVEATIDTIYGVVNVTISSQASGQAAATVNVVVAPRQALPRSGPRPPILSRFVRNR